MAADRTLPTDNYHTMSENTQIKQDEKPWNALLRMRGLPYGSVSYIIDPEQEHLVRNITQDCVQALWQPDVHRQFMATYRSWIASTQLNSIQGLEGFAAAAYSNGTTEAFDKFYLKHKNRRLRVFKGEYMYHLAVSEQYFSGTCYIEDEPLLAYDAVIVSWPFADTGGTHPGLARILPICESLGIPVMIDASYFGVCGGIDFDFTSPAIEAVVFSLSKTFPVPHLRTGMRLTRTDDDDALIIYNNTNYVNRLGAAIGLRLLQQSGPDDLFQRYRDLQVSFCQQTGVEPSDCVFFGIDQQGRYPEYNRGGPTNRLCWSKYLAQGQIPG